MMNLRNRPTDATDDVLEVVVGTGLDRTHYPADVTLTRIDLTERQCRAHELPFDEATFDTVVSTFGLCAISDLHATMAEMIRVLRPGGQLIVLDHW